MAFPEEIFRSYDIRGKHDQLSETLARHIGAAMVKLTEADIIVVGRDMRETSPALADAVKYGITSQGADVIDIGMCTTPMFNFAVSGFADHGAGVMVTASHNPPEYNGFKMADANGMPIRGIDMKNEIGEPTELVEKPTHGTVTKREIASEYLAKLFSLVQISNLKDLKIVIDAGNGMSGVILPKLFEELDCQMLPMYFNPDGNFPNHEANPIKTETLKDLVEKVKSENAHLGIALDGDGDRVGFVDEKGNAIRGDIIFALLISQRLSENPGGGIVWSPNASWAVRDAILSAGGESLLEKVGRTNIIRRMQEEDALLGGEVSAHYFYPEFGYLEATELTILLLLKMLAESRRTMSELIEPFNKYHGSGEINFEVKDKDAAIASLNDRYSPDAIATSDLDGIRIEFEDWWFNVRKSNTESLVRLNLEATSPELMVEKRDEIASLLQNL